MCPLPLPPVQPPSRSPFLAPSLAYLSCLRLFPLSRRSCEPSVCRLFLPLCTQSAFIALPFAPQRHARFPSSIIHPIFTGSLQIIPPVLPFRSLCETLCLFTPSSTRPVASFRPSLLNSAFPFFGVFSGALLPCVCAIVPALYFGSGICFAPSPVFRSPVPYSAASRFCFALHACRSLTVCKRALPLNTRSRFLTA